MVMNDTEMSRSDTQAIRMLKSAVAEGKHWYAALLEAIGLWSSSEEYYEGRHYRYLIDDEAFDWLTLAERLCEELDGLIPDKERMELLFFHTPPVEVPATEFKDFIGAHKYRTHLNYFYGVLLEQFLLLAVTEEVRKERRVSGVSSDDGVVDEAYSRVYGADRAALLKEFRKERRYPHLRSISLPHLDEFTYWLFKRRVRRSEKSCLASDTGKAIRKLQQEMRVKGKTHGRLAAQELKPGH